MVLGTVAPIGHLVAQQAQLLVAEQLEEERLDQVEKRCRQIWAPERPQVPQGMMEEKLQHQNQYLPQVGKLLHCRHK